VRLKNVVGWNNLSDEIGAADGDVVREWRRCVDGKAKGGFGGSVEIFAAAAEPSPVETKAVMPSAGLLPQGIEELILGGAEEEFALRRSFR